MSETKVKIRFYTIADFNEEEIWLRKEHQSGWKLVKMVPPCFYHFEKCQPEDVIYRLDFKNNGENADYMQMMKDYNWEYFEHCEDGYILGSQLQRYIQKMTASCFLIMNPVPL